MLNHSMWQTLLLTVFTLAFVGKASAQGNEDIWDQYFQVLLQQYKDQTGDSIYGALKNDDPEILAYTLFDSKKFSEAIVHLDKVVRKYPTGWNYFRRGYCHYMTQHYQLAVEDFTRSIARFPDPMLSPWWMGASVHQITEDMRYSRTISISLEYQYVDAYFYRAESKLMLEDYYGCIADIEGYHSILDTTVQRFPQIENAAYRLSGYSKLKIDDLDGAAEDFLFATTIDEQDERSHYYLGIVLIEKGSIPEGCRSLSRAGELGMKDAYEVIRSHCGPVR